MIFGKMKILLNIDSNIKSGLIGMMMKILVLLLKIIFLNN